MLKDRLVLVGVAAMSAVATAGWMRPTSVALAPQAMNFTSPILEPEPMIPVQSAAFASSAPQVVRTAGLSRAARYDAPRLQRTRPRMYDDRTRIAAPRSKAKSAAIIGGGAAAGAAIGALAGGGKGAAIGAITGGAGGYVYDRATRNKEAESPYRSSSSVYDDDRRTGRSTGERAAIIGGGAAAGAAIGGLAGGGKGAAIGAITGSAGGYVYDRVTRNR